MFNLEGDLPGQISQRSPEETTTAFQVASQIFSSDTRGTVALSRETDPKHHLKPKKQDDANPGKTGAHAQKFEHHTVR